MLDSALEAGLARRMAEIYRPSYLWLPASKLPEWPEGREVFRMGSHALLSTGEREPFILHEELALLMTTSGSTGSPKLVRQSKKNLQSNMHSIVESLGILPEDRVITNLPFHYVYGLSFVNALFYIGGSLIVTDASPIKKKFWRLMQEKKATILGGVPYTFEMLAELGFFSMDLPHLRLLTQAGGKLDPALHRIFAEYADRTGKQFVVMYGASEATSRMGYLPSKDSLRKVGCMGKAIPGGCFELVDETGRIVESCNILGELVYSGDNVAMGYAECGEDLGKGDEWNGRLATGDLAFRDTEGFYTIAGRRKRFLKLFGRRVNLQDVETVLREHFSTSEVAASGQDDRLVLYFTEQGTANEAIPWISRYLGFPPTAFEARCIAEIPRNSYGKILYTELTDGMELSRPFPIPSSC